MQCKDIDFGFGIFAPSSKLYIVFYYPYFLLYTFIICMTKTKNIWKFSCRIVYESFQSKLSIVIYSSNFTSNFLIYYDYHWYILWGLTLILIFLFYRNENSAGMITSRQTKNIEKNRFIHHVFISDVRFLTLIRLEMNLITNSGTYVLHKVVGRLDSLTLF